MFWFQVNCTLEKILFLDLGLAVTEVNTKKVKKQEKDIKNVKRCRDGMPKSPIPTSFSHYS